MKATAVARANIALAKYWGKSDDALNLPAVPSVSLTLDPLVTETTVELDEGLDDDVFELDGQPAKDGETKRVRALLDEVRALAGVTTRARVTSRNRFPTAAGLASSASGFAALAGAASAAVGLDDSAAVLSARARRASASAARSIFGGVVELPAGVPGDDALAARPIAAADHWDLRVVVAITASGRKSIGSRDAMGESRRSSPYYGAWVEHAATSTRAICDALLARDFAALAPLVEQSFLAMHAVGMAGIPSVLYWQPGSVAAIRTIQGLRADGLDVCATMDAGPHVKAVCTAAAAPSVREALAATDGVLDTLEARIGPGLEVTRG
ncbi:MAG: diphosphomevalonate decarboxylase [Sandaracinaceae bacterium]|nr:diphosphomevalonate decarboxylase [Sandaracinaceae bacterium]